MEYVIPTRLEFWRWGNGTNPTGWSEPQDDRDSGIDGDREEPEDAMELSDTDGIIGTPPEKAAPDDRAGHGGGSAPAYVEADEGKDTAGPHGPGTWNTYGDGRMESDELTRGMPRFAS
ncbi:MAG: hypothetical protein J0I17_02915 ['Candidatus Kapabacteria' thiocyanatum]|uniref:Uncharacterized protein n=1 Tax=Candidatus Kapaibacterium thiocyanatum TaxID=1895771 RepID=A0A1M3KXJ9_9BACT|nr:hypothetical protein ['Candidatus Kapabacteria' thiocyanatum]OJX57110.1 MAG: hypothetical protein BGO89_11435 ['Candidatus Kapabacteria' thiocyanatum]